MRSRSDYEHDYSRIAREWLGVKEPSALQFSRNPGVGLPAAEGTGKQAGLAWNLQPWPWCSISLLASVSLVWAAFRAIPAACLWCHQPWRGPCGLLEVPQQDMEIAALLDHILRSCHSQGVTRDEALPNIHEAISLWLEVEAEQAGDCARFSEARLRGYYRVGPPDPQQL